jgi:hypothetical protein
MTDLITLPRATVQQALEAWEHINLYGFVLADYEGPMEQAITALRAALEQPEPWVKSYCGGKPNYTTPAEQEPVAWACFKNGELQTELIGTEADVDFWCASDEPEMQGMVKGALYTHPPRRECLHAEVYEHTLALQQKSYEREIQIEVEAEREACAKVAKETVCDMHLGTGIKIYGTKAAAAIRARGNT